MGVLSLLHSPPVPTSSASSATALTKLTTFSLPGWDPAERGRSNRAHTRSNACLIRVPVSVTDVWRFPRLHLVDRQLDRIHFNPSREGEVLVSTAGDHNKKKGARRLKILTGARSSTQDAASLSMNGLHFLPLDQRKTCQRHHQEGPQRALIRHGCEHKIDADGCRS